MAESVETLRGLSDDDLVRRHDRLAKDTVRGTRMYLDELDRRSRERSAVAAENLAQEAVRLARRTYRLTWATVLLAGVAALIAVVALLAS